MGFTLTWNSVSTPRVVRRLFEWTLSMVSRWHHESPSRVAKSLLWMSNHSRDAFNIIVMRDAGAGGEGGGGERRTE
jgi:hypothetical protein